MRKRILASVMAIAMMFALLVLGPAPRAQASTVQTITATSSLYAGGFSGKPLLCKIRWVKQRSSISRTGYSYTYRRVCRPMTWWERTHRNINCWYWRLDGFKCSPFHFKNGSGVLVWR